MKLRKLRVHNFRAILDEEFYFSDYTLLVGPNNAGKSTVIDAIRAFYEKDGFKFSPHADFPHLSPPDDESWVELTFQLAEEEYASLADHYKVPSRELCLRKYFKTQHKSRDDKTAVGFIFAYRADGSLSNEPFYGARNVQSGKIGDIVYIPAISKVDEHAKLSGPSALRDLLDDIMSEVLESSRSYEEFRTAVQQFAQSIRTERTGDQRSLAGFEEQLNELLAPWLVEFRLEFPPPAAAEIIKSMTKWDVIDKTHGKPQSIDLYGSGFQRYFIYSLIQIGARYVGKKPSRKSKDFTPQLNLVLFEEPEAFLHPPQQEELATTLRALAGQMGWQVICATHSAHFVSKNARDIPAIIRLRRIDGKVEKFQITEADWNQIVDANGAIQAIAKRYPKMASRLQDALPEMEALKYFIWLNPNRTSAFFADHVLLVEGPTEVALINKLIADGRIRTSRSGLFIMDCLGKYNIHRFMNLFSRLGIPHSVVHDDDHDRDEHKELNQLIENSRHPRFTFEIRRIPGKLEEMLGIPSPKTDSIKPQYVLFLYETGSIDENRLQSFCSLVEQCLPDNRQDASNDRVAPVGASPSDGIARETVTAMS